MKVGEMRKRRRKKEWKEERDAEKNWEEKKIIEGGRGGG